MSHPIWMAWNVCLLNTNSIIKRWFCLEQCYLNNDTCTSVALTRLNHLQKVHRKTSIISTSYYNYYLGRHHSSYTRNWSESIASTLNRFCINKKSKSKMKRDKWNWSSSVIQDRRLTSIVRHLSKSQRDFTPWSIACKGSKYDCEVNCGEIFKSPLFRDFFTGSSRRSSHATE